MLTCSISIIFSNVLQTNWKLDHWQIWGCCPKVEDKEDQEQKPEARVKERQVVDRPGGQGAQKTKSPFLNI